jgi:fermentation-respiration switch protein FrsA (DUF1100 family)
MPLTAGTRLGPYEINRIRFLLEALTKHRAASPITYVSRTSAPILLLHSETDPTVPFEQSVMLEARYKSAGASATLVRMDAPHTHDFWNYTKFFPGAMDQAVTFLRRRLTQATPATPNQ